MEPASPLPRPARIVPGPDTEPVAAGYRQEYPRTDTTKLAELAGDYLLCTTGILDTHCPGPQDMVADCYRELGYEKLPLRYTAPRQLFLAMPEPHCRQLLLVPREISDAFVAIMGTFAVFQDPHLYRVRKQDIHCYEPVGLLPRRIPVLGFCLDATTGCVYFCRKLENALDYAMVRHDPSLVYADTRRMAQAYRLGSTEPYRDLEIPRD